MMELVGNVKWFHGAKGIGFIVVDGIDYFVHFKEIKMKGYKTLNEGESVRFTAIHGDRGWYARDVYLMSGVDLDPR